MLFASSISCVWSLQRDTFKGYNKLDGFNKSCAFSLRSTRKLPAGLTMFSVCCLDWEDGLSHPAQKNRSGWLPASHGWLLLGIKTANVAASYFYFRHQGLLPQLYLEIHHQTIGEFLYVDWQDDCELCFVRLLFFLHLAEEFLRGKWTLGESQSGICQRL